MAKARNEVPVPDERQDQECGRHGVFRPRQGEAEGDAGIDDEIADDVEVAAEIGERRMARHRAVETVGQPVDQDGGQRHAVPLRGQKGNRQQADREADNRNRVGRYTDSRESAPDAIERRIDDPPHAGIKHLIHMYKLSSPIIELLIFTHIFPPATGPW